MESEEKLNLLLVAATVISIITFTVVHLKSENRRFQYRNCKTYTLNDSTFNRTPFADSTISVKQ